jgi:hypothetical protein
VGSRIEIGAPRGGGRRTTTRERARALDILLILVLPAVVFAGLVCWARRVS